MHGLPGDIPRGALVVRLYESLSAQGERGEVPSFSVPAEDPMHDVIRDLNGLCEVWSKHALQWPDTIELCPPEMSAGREIMWYRAFVASGLALQMWARDSRVDLGGRPYRWVHHRIIEAWQKIKKGPGEWRRSDIDDLCHSILYFVSTRVVDSSWEWWPIAALSKALRWLDAHPTEPTQHLLARVVEAVPHVELCFIKDFLRIADAASGDLILLRPGEPWTDRAREDLAALGTAERAAWSRLLRWCVGVEGAMPLRRHESEMRELLAGVGADKAHGLVLRWVSMFDQTPMVHERHRAIPRADDPGPERLESYERVQEIMRWQALHQRVAKGLVWTLRGAPIERSGPVLERVAVACFGRGFLSGTCGALVGGACVAALCGQAEPKAVAHLMRIRERSRIKPGRAAAERGLAAVAAKLGVSAEDVEELGVPTFGLGVDGRRVSPCGTGQLELRLASDGEVSMVYTDPRGKSLRSVPAAARAASPEVVVQFKADVKLLRGVISSSWRRFDRSLRSERSWAAADWRTRILGHPVLGITANGLIWSVIEADGACTRQFLLVDGAATDEAGREVPLPADHERVRLWHPIDSDATEVETWRRRVEKAVTQPFRQAHRETYRPDRSDGKDPDRSRRFGDLVVRHGLLAGLCKAREWAMAHFIMDSGSGPEWRGRNGQPSARLEVQPIGTETEPSGAFSYLVSGNTRFFHREESAEHPLKLADTPPRFFSEIMRDIDLLVTVSGISRDSSSLGAASVGNTIEWTRLATTAPSAVVRQRADLFGRLCASAAMGPHVSMDSDRLVVRGALATYEIDVSDGSFLVRENGMRIQVAESDIPAEFQPPRLPYGDDDRATRMLRTALMLAQDIRLENQEWVRKITWRSGMEP